MVFNGMGQMDGAEKSRNYSVQPERVLDLVNQARSTYDAPQLIELLPGEVRSASFCPLGRSFRAGVENRLFTAVGTKYLRVWTPGKNSADVAREILRVWKIPENQMKKTGEKSGYVLIPLPSELRQFVEQFDRSLLPRYKCEVSPQEVLRLRELARGMPIPGRQKKVFSSGTRGAR